MNLDQTIKTKVSITENVVKAIDIMIEKMQRNDPNDTFRLNQIPAFEELKKKKGLLCDCELRYAYKEEGEDYYEVGIIDPNVNSGFAWRTRSCAIPLEAFFLVKNETEGKFAPPIEMWLETLNK